MLTMHEIPILGYDDSSPEVIPPDFEWTAGRLPEKCLFAFLRNAVHEYAAARDAQVVQMLKSITLDIQIDAIE